MISENSKPLDSFRVLRIVYFHAGFMLLTFPPIFPSQIENIFLKIFLFVPQSETFVNLFLYKVSQKCGNICGLLLNSFNIFFCKNFRFR